MTPEVKAALDTLTEPQKIGAEWMNGAMLMLAGPGSGKTRVLTTRVASILDNSRDRGFRVLALTFTNRAADEMAGRVAALVPGLESRALIGTFHSLCMQVLQQHGSHLGIRPDFSIYSHDEDRNIILKTGLQRCGMSPGDAARYLPLIDKCKSRLITSDDCVRYFKNKDEGLRFQRVYAAFDAEMKESNAMDFPSLIERAYTLVKTFPGVAISYRRVYAHWMLDEFQDTNDGQYRFLTVLAGDSFRNIFAVADDDQIIYRWNGASYKQIQRFRADFAPQEIQLPTNYRCPPAIVVAANRLVVHNSERTAGKRPLEAGKVKMQYSDERHIRTLAFATDQDECRGIAEDVRDLGCPDRGAIAILARTKKQLDGIKASLSEVDIPCIISQRRDDFVSPHFQWLAAVLTQAVRPLDGRNFGTVVSSFDRIYRLGVRPDELIAAATATSRSYLEEWSQSLHREKAPSDAIRLADLANELASDRSRFRTVVSSILKAFPISSSEDDQSSDFAEDAAAWKELWKSIGRSLGQDASLEQFLQELAMRSKEPPAAKGAISLMTIHAAKGKEFDHVYLVGLAEGVLPSFQSVNAGESSPEMEEERRNCFVAVTRARECLTLSWADRYRGWSKAPSRFLEEMGIDVGTVPRIS